MLRTVRVRATFCSMLVVLVAGWSTGLLGATWIRLAAPACDVSEHSSCWDINEDFDEDCEQFCGTGVCEDACSTTPATGACTSYTEAVSSDPTHRQAYNNECGEGEAMCYCECDCKSSVIES